MERQPPADPAAATASTGRSHGDVVCAQLLDPDGSQIRIWRPTAG